MILQKNCKSKQILRISFGTKRLLKARYSFFKPVVQFVTEGVKTREKEVFVGLVGFMLLYFL